MIKVYKKTIEFTQKVLFIIFSQREFLEQCDIYVLIIKHVEEAKSMVQLTVKKELALKEQVLHASNV